MRKLGWWEFLLGAHHGEGFWFWHFHPSGSLQKNGDFQLQHDLLLGNRSATGNCWNWNTLSLHMEVCVGIYEEQHDSVWKWVIHTKKSARNQSPKQQELEGPGSTNCTKRCSIWHSKEKEEKDNRGVNMVGRPQSDYERGKERRTGNRIGVREPKSLITFYVKIVSWQMLPSVITIKTLLVFYSAWRYLNLCVLQTAF